MQYKIPLSWHSSFIYFFYLNNCSACIYVSIYVSVPLRILQDVSLWIYSDMSLAHHKMRKNIALHFFPVRFCFLFHNTKVRIYYLLFYTSVIYVLCLIIFVRVDEYVYSTYRNNVSSMHWVELIIVQYKCLFRGMNTCHALHFTESTLS